MADIELVIKIPERDYDLACKYPDALIATYAHYIKDGTLLPKGHGDLIDINNINEITLEDSLHCISYEKGNEVDCYIDAPVIVKADKEGE